jgi:beta-glucosidase
MMSVVALLCMFLLSSSPTVAAERLAAGLEQHWRAKAARWPWFNTSLPVEERLRRLVDAMTADELITQLVKYSQPIQRLGVPGYAWHMEAAHGIVTGGDATSFPCSLARAAAFHPELEHKIARAIGVEARAKWNDFLRLHGAPPGYHTQGLALTLYSPEINLCRDPRWGRCQESRGEDPELTSRLTVPFVRGLQFHPASDSVLLTTAMLKDFVVYNVESSQPVGAPCSHMHIVTATNPRCTVSQPSNALRDSSV